MKQTRIAWTVLLAAAVALGAAALLAPAPEAAPECVDPDLCPIIICPPDHEFVPTTCKECAHCEPTGGGKGKGGGKGGGKPVN